MFSDKPYLVAAGAMAQKKDATGDVPMNLGVFFLDTR